MSGPERNLRKNSFDSRQSNIELLRIITMIMIVANHFARHSGFDFPAGTVTLNSLWIQFMAIGGKIGVDIFVLISGYFSVKSSVFKTNKAVRLWLQIFTYSALAFLIFVLCGIQPFRVKELIEHALPVTFSHWWFASTFFVLYLISPYINKLLTTFDKKTYKRFLILLFVLWSVIPTLTGQDLQCNNLLWFVFVYASAGYIRLHAGQSGLKGSKCLLVSLALVMLIFGFTAALDFAGTKIPAISSYANYFYAMHKVPVFLAAVFAFMGVLDIDIGKKPFINIISSATFGVYLIHDEGYVRRFLWETLLKNSSYAESKLLIPYSLAVVAAVFICSVLIELARKYFLENHYLKAVDKIADKIDSFNEKLFKDKK